MYYVIIPTDDDITHHGILGQKWGRKNGPPYPLNSEILSNKIFKEAKRVEPKITKDVKTASNIAGSKMYGLEHRLKTKESIQRKIETDSKEKKISESKAASNIKDAVRYTTISKDNDFVSNYNTIKNALETIGYKEIRCKNYFQLYKEGKVKHKSVQSIYEDPNGYKFEIQFQTPSSQLAKDKKIPIYEERRKPGIEKDRAIELEKMMDDLAKEVKEPKNISSIKSH